MKMRGIGDIIIPLASNPWWNPDGLTGPSVCLGAWQAKGAESYAASLVDLTGNGNNLSEIGGGPVNWAATVGWSGFSTLTRALDTGIVPDVYPANSYSFLVQYAGPGADDQALGCSQGSNKSFGACLITPVGTGLYNGNFLAVLGDHSDGGNFAAGGSRGYRNGADVGAIAAGADDILVPCYIGAMNHAVNGVISHFTANILAVAIYNATLTGPQVLARALAMAAL